jgi:N-acetylmuramoyl-L-alanine amidase
MVIGVLSISFLAAACSSGKSDRASGSSSSSSSSTSSPTTTASSTSTTAPASTTTTRGTSAPAVFPTPASGVLVVGEEGATLADGPRGAATGRLRAGVTVSYDAVQQGWARVLTPCENRVWLRLDSGRQQRKAQVVIDPGHGGNEVGAVGPTKLTEKELNLDVSRRVVEDLRALDIDAVLTRPLDYRVTIASRVAIAGALDPGAFVSIHHNAEPDVARDGPGTETFYQYHSPQSKRLAGLIYEEVVKALSAFTASWMADADAGAKWRLNDSGGDYYGILRRGGDAGLVSVLAELAFISNPTEEALLRREDVRRAEAGAVSRAIVRFLRTDDPGSGFTVPYARKEPAGPGGGSTGCVDPS